MLHALKNVGDVIQSIGIALMLIMAVIETVVVDIMIFFIILLPLPVFFEIIGWKALFPCTQILWASISSNHNPILLMFLTATTIIGFSLISGAPMIGISVMAGWGAAIGTYSIGTLIAHLADIGLEYFDVGVAPSPGADDANTNVYIPASAVPVPDAAVFLNEHREKRHQANASASNSGFFSSSRPVDVVPVAHSEEHSVPLPHY